MLPSQPLLETALAEEKDRREIERRLKKLEDDFADLKQRVTKAAKDGVELMLHRMFAPLHQATSVLVGDTKITDLSEGQPISSGRYDAWKQRLSPSCGKVIDALLVEPMGRNQLRKFCEIGWSTLDAALATLKNNQLVAKDGDRWRLKP